MRPAVRRLVLMAAAVACGEKADPVAAPPEHWQRPGEVVGEAPVDEPPGRARRRLDIDQLDAALRHVSGGIGWVRASGNVEINRLEELASTLGKPDYVQLTREDLESTVVFQKFLRDAAQSVCSRVVERELGTAPSRRVFFARSLPSDTPAVGESRFEANLSYLLMRFHGRVVPAYDPKLEPWRWLWQSSFHVSGSTLLAWKNLCVGLIVHPDFYTY